MSNSGLYYIVHWSWNILFNVSPLMWPWKFCACADWQVCTKAGHTKTPFPGISRKSKCTKVKTPVCTPWSWHTMSKHPEFLWRILEKGMHPTFSIDRKPSSVGLRKTTTMLEHTALDRLGESKLLPAGLVDLQKFLAMVQHANSSRVTDFGRPQSSFLTRTDVEGSSFESHQETSDCPHCYPGSLMSIFKTKTVWCPFLV